MVEVIDDYLSAKGKMAKFFKYLSSTDVLRTQYLINNSS
jgi:hypothetical protein